MWLLSKARIVGEIHPAGAVCSSQLNYLNIAKTKRQHIVLPKDNSPDEASLEELARPPESIGQMLPKKDSSMSCSFCNFDLKMFNDSDSTTDDSSWFQVLKTRSVKKMHRRI